MIVDVVIPALNEEKSIPLVLKDIDRQLVRHVFVVDNGSTDQTMMVAGNAGAVVLSQPKRGYGNACLKGIEESLVQEPLPDIIAFMDADYSDHPEQLIDVLGPIRDDKADMVIGSRALGQREKGSMTPQQIFGNWLAVTLIKLLHSHSYTDLGPFRAIRRDSLEKIEMQDPTYGWTVEMQLKVLKHKMKVVEVPVNYRKRIGKSKIAGTVKGTILAGHKIITTILKYR